eukprot:996694-Pleurochrysis_carterae.AAC.2
MRLVQGMHRVWWCAVDAAELLEHPYQGAISREVEFAIQSITNLLSCTQHQLRFGDDDHSQRCKEQRTEPTRPDPQCALFWNDHEQVSFVCERTPSAQGSHRALRPHHPDDGVISVQGSER